MKLHTIIGICFVLLAYACTPTIHPIERYANELAGSKELAKHADYFTIEYAGATKDEAYWAHRAIHEGSILAAQYDTLFKKGIKKKAIKRTPISSIVSNMKTMQAVLASHLRTVNLVWASALNNQSQYKTYVVDFSTALTITHKEYTRMEVFSKMDLVKGKIAVGAFAYKKQKYPNTRGLYVVLFQLIELARRWPETDLKTFVSTANDLNRNFSKKLALAEEEVSKVEF
jgi:hypothetical protein